MRPASTASSPTGKAGSTPAPGIETVAGRMGVVTATAQKARRELEQTGWLRIKRRPGRPSRIQLVSTDEPMYETQGSDWATPARTPAPTPARTPASAAPEPENQITRGPGDAHAGACARPTSQNEPSLAGRTNSRRRGVTDAELEAIADGMVWPEDDQ